MFLHACLDFKISSMSDFGLPLAIVLCLQGMYTENNGEFSLCITEKEKLTDSV